ncbi:MAG: YggS family pyridoxal phosphate-dependent enzyme [Prevotellaceae bacterium]|jgi:pyridoxal phosphate enzyme (YggS family)|nr:YggS family pyridoxal phosphate-dependent enzyme [Prevotellaceae bacterium]
MSIASKITEINANLPGTTRLVAVSKFHPAPAIQEAYDAGQRIFGESKVQELVEKQDLLPKDIEWHFIGHLQTNKVKYIIPFISFIHSADTVKLLEVINKQAEKQRRIINCLLEIHIAREDTKYGFTIEEARSLFEKNTLGKFENVCIRGFMGMASLTDDMRKIRTEFRTLSAFFNEIKEKYAPWFDTLSMGMTDDYKIAIEEGSTLIRIGSYIFGNRGND